MAWTSHGHHVPGTPIDDDKTRPPIARCGGLRLCKTCQKEATIYKEEMEKSDPKDSQVSESPEEKALLEKLVVAANESAKERELTRRAGIAAYNHIFMKIQEVIQTNDHFRGGLHPETTETHDRAVEFLGRAAEHVLLISGVDRTFLDEWFAKNQKKETKTDG